MVILNYRSYWSGLIQTPFAQFSSLNYRQIVLKDRDETCCNSWLTLHWKGSDLGPAQFHYSRWYKTANGRELLFQCHDLQESFSWPLSQSTEWHGVKRFQGREAKGREEYQSSPKCSSSCGRHVNAGLRLHIKLWSPIFIAHGFSRAKLPQSLISPCRLIHRWIGHKVKITQVFTTGRSGWNRRISGIDRSMWADSIQLPLSSTSAKSSLDLKQKNFETWKNDIQGACLWHLRNFQSRLCANFEAPTTFPRCCWPAKWVSPENIKEAGMMLASLSMAIVTVAGL